MFVPIHVHLHVDASTLHVRTGSLFTWLLLHVCTRAVFVWELSLSDLLSHVCVVQCQCVWEGRDLCAIVCKQCLHQQPSATHTHAKMKHTINNISFAVPYM